MVFKALKQVALTKGKCVDRWQMGLGTAQCHANILRSSLSPGALLYQMGLILSLAMLIDCDDKAQHIRQGHRSQGLGRWALGSN